MKEAKDYNEALEIATNNLPENDFSKSGECIIKVNKKVGVLINNNSGKVPNQITKGWEFNFITTPSGWELDSAQRY